MIDRADLDRVEDVLRSEIEYCRGRIDGGYEKLIELYEFKGTIEKAFNEQAKKIENLGRRLDKLFYFFMSLLFIIIASLISKLIGVW